MLNRLKYKESNIFVDIWFIEKLQQERRGEFSIRLGEKREQQWGGHCSPALWHQIPVLEWEATLSPI